MSDSSESCHCSYCLKVISLDEVKRCGKCRKRRYCGADCQLADWKPKGHLLGNGQGHRLWCGMEVGEEDVDWEILPMEEKGRGIFAKRALPSNYRVMVDGFGLKDSELFADEFGSKFCKEKLERNLERGFSTLGRSALINHSCKGNSCKLPMISPSRKGVDAMIILTQREIAQGEEILNNYTCFNETSSQSIIKTTEEHRAELKKRWKIICPADCFCRKPGLDQQLNEIRQKDALIGQDGCPDVDLEIVRQLLKCAEIVHSSSMDRFRLNILGFEAAVQRKNTLSLAQKYIKEACEFLAAAFHPKYEMRKKYQLFNNDLRFHTNYLKLETSGKMSD